MEINEYLQRLKDEGNFRSIPLETKAYVVVGLASAGLASD